jgi:hypothetical protein
MGIVAMLVHATGAPAFVAACSGGSSGSQWIPRNRRPVTLAAVSETSHNSGDTMTSGWIILVRSKPDSDTIGVFVMPPGDQDVNGHSGAVEVLRHDRAEGLECGLGGSVGWEARIYHRAEASRDIDDPTPSLAHHFGHNRVRQGQRRRRVHRDEAAPLIGRDLPEFEGTLPAVRPDCSRADAGIVDQDVDAAEPIAGGSGDLLGRGIAGEIGLNGEKVIPFPCSRAFAGRVSSGPQSRSTPATRMPAVSRPPTMALPMPPAAQVTIATLWVSAIVGSSLVARVYPTSDLRGGVGAAVK